MSARRHGSPAPTSGPPPPSRLAFLAFTAYAERYVARHLHALHLLGEPPALRREDALVVYLNHPSWWDPLLALVLARRLFPERRHHGPIDRAALGRYRLLARVGLFGVEPTGVAGARRFLAASEAVLGRAGTALWVTPQGRLADPRERPAALRPGLARLARRAAEGSVGRPVAFVPLALELPFWEERTPEALACFGRPLVVPGDEVGEAGTAPGWGGIAAGEAVGALLAARLEEAQGRLAAAALARDGDAFRTLVRGRAGVGGVYDRWRALAARWRGTPFRAEHGTR